MCCVGRPDRRGRARGLSRRGLTLIEMLVALGLVSLVAVGLYGAFWSGVRVQRRVDGMNGIYREARWSFDRAARDLENMVPFSWDAAAAKSGPRLDEQGLSFVTATGHGLRVVRYAWERPDFGVIERVGVGRRSRRNETVVTGESKAPGVAFLVRTSWRLSEGGLEPPKDPAEVDRQVLSTRLREGGARFVLFDLDQAGSGKTTLRSGDAPRAGVRMTLIFLTDETPSKEIQLSRDILIPTMAWGLPGRRSRSR